MSTAFKQSLVIKKIKELQTLINQQLQNQDPKVLESIELLHSFGALESYYLALSTYQFNEQRYEESLATAKQGVLQHPFSYNLNFNVGMASYAVGDYEQAFIYFGHTIRRAATEDLYEDAMNTALEIADVLKTEGLIKEATLKQHLILMQKLSQQTDQKRYPINGFNESDIRKVYRQGTENENLTNLYKSLFLKDITIDDRFLVKSEMIQGQAVMQKTIKMTGDFVVPISYIEKAVPFTIKTANEEITYAEDVLDIQQYHYLTFEAGEIAIKAEQPIFVGKPMLLKDEPKDKKLILHIFADGLSQMFLDEQGLEELMPYTYAFFKKGYINTNTFASSEWTYPSLASVVTGKSVYGHGTYHPDFNYDIAAHNEMLISKIKDAGYHTMQINTDWQSTPTFGYDTMFNRILYQNSLGGLQTNEIVGEVLEYLEAFKGKNNYVWLTLEDLHDVVDTIFDDIIPQVNIKAKYRAVKNTSKPSVHSDYDEAKIAAYRAEIKRLDFHLNIIYTYIEQHYTEDEILIIFNSDHGQSFLVNNEYSFIHEYRRRVPLMLRGGGVPQVMSNELASNTDIYPTILQLLQIPYSDELIEGELLKDFGGKKRNYAISECLYPKQTYKVIVETDDLTLYFKALDNVDVLGKVDLEYYKIDIELKNETLDQRQIENHIDEIVEYILRTRIGLQRSSES